jgi:hypothetical protein
MMKFFRKSSGGSSESATSKSAVPGKQQRGGSSGAGGGVTSDDGKSTIFRVTIPAGTLPGQEFQVYAGTKIVRVRCPPNSSPGQSLQITVPIDPIVPPDHEQRPMGPPDSPNAQRQEDGAYMVTVPDGVRSGQQFPVTIAGQTLMVTSPPNARSGTQVRVVPPPPPPTTTTKSMQDTSFPPNGGSVYSNGNNNTSMNPSSSQFRSSEISKEDDETQMFEVMVPTGVEPGKPFALLAGGVRVLVTCPVNASAGQRIRFRLPKALTQKREPTSEAAAIKLSYDKDGWTRTIRVSDMKFQWVRMDDKGDVDNTTRFMADKSAYVRKLEFRPGNDDRVRDAILTLVPAAEAFVDSRVRGNNGEVIVTYAEIADAQVKTFEEKTAWFQEKCLDLGVEWNEGHMRINVRREFLLEDSVDAVMSLSRRDLRKLWRFEFIGEMGIDAGGLAREWFELVTKEVFDPDMGLWQSSEANQMMMVINPASSKCLGPCIMICSVVCFVFYDNTIWMMILFCVICFQYTKLFTIQCRNSHMRINPL